MALTPTCDTHRVLGHRRSLRRKIYAASSWRNYYQPYVVDVLREAGHEVYDFRNPTTGFDNPNPDAVGFHWSAIDPEWETWTPQQYVEALRNHPLAQQGFASDKYAMEWADTCVLVMPCGRSAHLEAGYFTGALTSGTLGLRKQLFILLQPGDQFEPELMYLMANGIAVGEAELVKMLS